MTRLKQGRWLLKRVTFGFAIAAGLMGADFDWDLPKGFPRPPVPADNPMSVAKVELGRYLFYLHDGSLATLEEVIDHYRAGGKWITRKNRVSCVPFALAIARSAIWSSFSIRSPTKRCSTILAGATRGPQWAANPYPALLRLT